MDIEGLVQRLYCGQRIEIVEHVAFDPHRRLEAGAAEYHAVAGALTFRLAMFASSMMTKFSAVL